MKPISAGHASINKAWVNKAWINKSRVSKSRWTEAARASGGNYPCARELRLTVPGLAVEALVAIS